jgi:hypothetical protein
MPAAAQIRTRSAAAHDSVLLSRSPPYGYPRGIVLRSTNVMLPILLHSMMRIINCGGLLAQQDMVGNPEKFCISGPPSVGCNVTLKLFSRLLTNKQPDFRIADAGIDTVCTRIATIADTP